MDTQFPGLEVADRIIAWSSLIFITFYEIFVFAKLRFTMDNSAIFLQLTFILVLIQRVIVDFFKEPTLLVTILAPIASIISYALLYYFVFEMMYIVSTIKSMSHIDNRERNRRIKISKIILFAFYLGIYTPSTLIGHIMQKENPKFYFANITFFTANQILRSVIKIPMDLYMIYKFL